MIDKKRTLIARRVRFYSDLDERTFFTWLHELAPVTRVVGERDQILIDYNPVLVDDNSLRELIAVFFRYKIDLKQLDVFLTTENRDWFMDPNAYWRHST